MKSFHEPSASARSGLGNSFPFLHILRTRRASESTISHLIGLIIHRNSVLHENPLGETCSGFHFHGLSLAAVIGELHLDMALVVRSVVVAVDDSDGIV